MRALIEQHAPNKLQRVLHAIALGDGFLHRDLP